MAKSGTEESRGGGGGWKDERMDPSGVSSRWGNENKCLQQFFFKVNQCPPGCVRKSHAPGVECLSLPVENLQRSLFEVHMFAIGFSQPCWVQGAERMVLISWICGPHQGLYFPEGRAVLAPKGYSKGSPAPLH